MRTHVIIFPLEKKEEGWKAIRDGIEQVKKAVHEYWKVGEQVRGVIRVLDERRIPYLHHIYNCYVSRDDALANAEAAASPKFKAARTTSWIIYEPDYEIDPPIEFSTKDLLCLVPLALMFLLPRILKG